MTNNILKEIEIIFNEIFNNPSYDKSFSDLKINDIGEWDSIGNFNLLLAIEFFFNIKFSFEEMSNLKSIDAIYDVIKKKLYE